MKITEVKEIEPNIFELTYTPQFLDKVFGQKQRKKLYKCDPDSEYVNRKGHNVIITKEGEVLGCGNEIVTQINNFKRKW